MTTLDPRSIDLGGLLKTTMDRWSGPSPSAAQARYRTAAASGAPRSRRPVAAAGLAFAMVAVMGGLAAAYSGFTVPFTQVHVGGGGSAGPQVPPHQPSISLPIAASSSSQPACTTAAGCVATPEHGRPNATGPTGAAPAAVPPSPATGSSPPAGDSGPPQGSNPAPTGSPTPCIPGWGQGDGGGQNHPKGTPPPKCN
jgi:hypothetical protein